MAESKPNPDANRAHAKTDARGANSSQGSSTEPSSAAAVDRRKFLGGALTLAAGSAAWGSGAWSPTAQVFGAPLIQTSGKTKVLRPTSTLVVIYLRGGCDPLNTIVPYRDADYYSLRPTIAVPSPLDPKRPAELAPALPLDKVFALHPSMKPLHALYQKGLVAPIVNVGSNHGTRSHFDAQDFMEWAAPGIKSIQEGWLNRYLQRTAKPNDHYLRAFSPQALLPRSLRGRYSVLAAPGEGSDEALSAFEELYAPCDEHESLAEKKRREEREAIAKLPPTKRRAKERALAKREREEGQPPFTEKHLGPKVQNAGVNTIEKLRHLNRILSDKPKDGSGYPDGELSRQLADIATVLKAGEPLEISALDYGGWDHHSYQGGSNGTQARMLGHLSQSIAAFVRDLGEERMKKVTILTMTEFGRTVAENGSVGTDHGHGGSMLAIGGNVQGGRVYGDWKGLTSRSLYQGRDLPVTTDFRDVFAEVLRDVFTFDPAEDAFFPEYDRLLQKPIGLFGKA